MLGSYDDVPINRFFFFFVSAEHTTYRRIQWSRIVHSFGNIFIYSQVVFFSFFSTSEFFKKRILRCVLLFLFTYKGNDVMGGVFFFRKKRITTAGTSATASGSTEYTSSDERSIVSSRFKGAFLSPHLYYNIIPLSTFNSNDFDEAYYTKEKYNIQCNNRKKRIE